MFEETVSLAENTLTSTLSRRPTLFTSPSSNFSYTRLKLYDSRAKGVVKKEISFLLEKFLPASAEADAYN